MEYIEKIKKMLCKELDEYAMKGKLTMADLDAVHKLTDTVKNLDKIEMLEEESGGYSEARGGRGRGGRSSYEGGMSYDDDMMYSERRGRGRNARRDSMGRYSREGGYSEEGGSSYEGGSYRRGGSSYEGGGTGGQMGGNMGGNSSYARGGQGRGGRGGSSYGGAKEHMIQKMEEMLEMAESPKERRAIEKCLDEIED